MRIIITNYENTNSMNLTPGKIMDHEGRMRLSDLKQILEPNWGEYGKGKYVSVRFVPENANETNAISKLQFFQDNGEKRNFEWRLPVKQYILEDGTMLPQISKACFNELKKYLKEDLTAYYQNLGLMPETEESLRTFSTKQNAV